MSDDANKKPACNSCVVLVGPHGREGVCKPVHCGLDAHRDDVLHRGGAETGPCVWWEGEGERAQATVATRAEMLAELRTHVAIERAFGDNEFETRREWLGGRDVDASSDRAARIVAALYGPGAVGAYAITVREGETVTLPGSGDRIDVGTTEPSWDEQRAANAAAAVAGDQGPTTVTLDGEGRITTPGPFSGMRLVADVERGPALGLDGAGRTVLAPGGARAAGLTPIGDLASIEYQTPNGPRRVDFPDADDRAARAAALAERMRAGLCGATGCGVVAQRACRCGRCVPAYCACFDHVERMDNTHVLAHGVMGDWTSDVPSAALTSNNPSPGMRALFERAAAETSTTMRAPNGQRYTESGGSTRLTPPPSRDEVQRDGTARRCRAPGCDAPATRACECGVCEPAARACDTHRSMVERAHARGYAGRAALWNTDIEDAR